MKAAKIPFADDPTNRDPRFTRARLRGLMPGLAGEGLDAPRLATLARRLARAEAALAQAAAEAFDRLAEQKSGRIAFDRAGFAGLPPKSPCACSAAPSTPSATKDRSNSASSKGARGRLRPPGRRARPVSADPGRGGDDAHRHGHHGRTRPAAAQPRLNQAPGEPAKGRQKALDYWKSDPFHAEGPCIHCVDVTSP